MIDIFRHILAQNDVEPWLNLLFIILFAVFAILGKFLKSTTNKDAGPDKPEARQPKRRVWTPASMQPKRRPERFEPRVNVESHKRAAPVKTTSQQRLSELNIDRPAHAGAEGASPMVAEILANLHTPENLRKAVLYSEILGKPTALKSE